MRTENAPVIRLEDYRPSDYGIDRVDLDVWLHPPRPAFARSSRCVQT